MIEVNDIEFDSVDLMDSTCAGMALNEKSKLLVFKMKNISFMENIKKFSTKDKYEGFIDFKNVSSFVIRISENKELIEKTIDLSERKDSDGMFLFGTTMENDRTIEMIIYADSCGLNLYPQSKHGVVRAIPVKGFTKTKTSQGKYIHPPTKNKFDRAAERKTSYSPNWAAKRGGNSGKMHQMDEFLRHVAKVNKQT